MLAPTRTIPPGQRLALAVLCAATLMTIVDETVVSVALPTIQRELGFSSRDLSWVVNAYLIAFGGLLLLAGRLGDLIGRKRVLLGGLVVFIAASALCGLATSPAWLVAARFAQGAGGAAATAVGLGMVAALFDDEGQRLRAFGIYAVVGAAGASTGLFAGGLITDLADWRWAFFINIPIGLATLVAGARVLPPERGIGVTRSADLAGAVLVVSGLMLAVAAIVGAQSHGLTGTRTLGLGGAAALLLALFVARQATAAQPLLALRVLRSRTVVVTNAAHALLVAAMFGFQFLITLYLQRVLGYGPARAGLAVLPIALGIGAMSLLVFNRLERRLGAGTVLPLGLAAVAAGLALLSRAPVDGAYVPDVLPSALLLAVGGGLALPAAMTLAMSSASARDAGMASGLINTSQQVGGAVGLAVLATLAAGRTAASRDHGAAPAQALVDGFGLAWGVGSLLVVAALVLAVVGLRRPTRTARRDAPVRCDAVSATGTANASHRTAPPSPHRMPCGT